MNRLLIVIVAIGVVIGLFGSDGSDSAAPTKDEASAGTFSSTSSDRPSRRSQRLAASREPQSVAFSSGGDVVLQRDPSGHFYVDAQVNGMPVHFLVDTGASGVALTTADAQKVGLQFSRGEFTAVGRGASGTVNGAFVTLGRVSVQGKSVENVEGAIIEGGDTSLLGQSFLSRMGTIEIKGDRMVIR